MVRLRNPVVRTHRRLLEVHVRAEGIEPSAFPLSEGCSTTELRSRVKNISKYNDYPPAKKFLVKINFWKKSCPQVIHSFELSKSIALSSIDATINLYCQFLSVYPFLRKKKDPGKKLINTRNIN